VRKTLVLLATLAAWAMSGLALAAEYDLVIDKRSINLTGQARTAIAINGSVPGPTLRWREGEDVILRVTNRLDEPTSIHWHGILLPAGMDGVPGISFAGITPGATFTYRFPIKQSGTYWYHSHSEFQEQAGMYTPIIIEPARPAPYRYDRDYVVMLSDWTDEDPHRVFAKLKKLSGYYNFQKRTVFDVFRDAAATDWGPTIADRLAWGRMRMDPTDIADVTGYTYTFLLNGQPPAANWTALFKPGERVRLRFINGSAMTYFDVRIPGLKMTVVQADGQDVQPVTVDELRIAVAETYDVIVEPGENRAYTLFAETMDRSGHARGTLAPRGGMTAPVPERRPRPLLTMADMGMDHGAMGHGAAKPDQGSGAVHPGHGMGGAPAMNHGGADHGAMRDHQSTKAEAPMDHEAMGHSAPAGSNDGMQPLIHGPDHHGPGNAMVAMVAKSRLAEPGLGLENTPDHRVLLYADLRSREPGYDRRQPAREIELHLTGNMERFMWSFDGKKFSEAEPIPLRYGERVRFTLVNDTMMNHPMHLHGMWSELVNGAGPHQPRKHVINVKPTERISFDVTADAPGEWAFHCHLLYHMEAGMFRKVIVAKDDKAADKRAVKSSLIPEERY
jgi:CopA family copper-resistance protein